MTVDMIPIATAVVGAAIGAFGMWYKAKTDIHAFRVLIDNVDDAVRDDKVTEDEFRKVWNGVVSIVRGESK